MTKSIHLFLAFAFVFFLSGCNGQLDDVQPNTDGFWIGITASDDKGNSYSETITASDIDYYDTSSHYVYLKEEKPYLGKIQHGSFTLYAGNKEIDKGSFHSLYLSSLPVGIYVHTSPKLTPDYIFDISWMYILQHADDPAPDDPRDSQKLIKALKANSQYREGLSCKIQSVRFLSKGSVELKFRLTNNDNTNYYYLDPDKTGLSLFHYFTNGPIFFNIENPNHYYHNMEVTTPEPWDSWKKEWLSLIKGHETKDFTFTYPFAPMPDGKYRVFFSFPGLSHVNLSDLDRTDGRIWLGESQASITVNK